MYFSLIELVVLGLSCATIATAAPSARSIYVRRSTSPATCANNAQCKPKAFANNTIPMKFVECRNGQCYCSECFFLNNTENRCYINPPCTEYNANNAQCTDNRKKSLTAFLLTFFLVPTGAANFYIDRLEFAIPQLILGIIYICFHLVFPCIGASVVVESFKIGENVDKNTLRLGFAKCSLCIPYCLLAMLFFSWWIADLVIFATNQRLDGNGCDLIDNM